VKLVVHRLGAIDSTQDEARRLLRRGEAEVGHVVLADEQESGRGRFGRTWISPRGGLYATFVLPGIGLASLRVGVATVRALAEVGLDAKLKWPNDLLVGERKLAGILIEREGDRLLAGLGVNLRDAPLSTAISAAALGITIDRDDLAASIWAVLRQAESEAETLKAYRARCATLGRRVRVVQGEGDAVKGVAIDVDEEGRLLVEAAGRTITVSSGPCEHLDEQG